MKTIRVGDNKHLVERANHWEYWEDKIQYYIPFTTYSQEYVLKGPVEKHQITGQKAFLSVEDESAIIEKVLGILRKHHVECSSPVVDE